jgi:predicted ATP-binding protein involved in virulence
MRLVSFSVQKYRSIIKAERFRLGDLTILIGPNNEGKSNILKALVAGMRLLSGVEGRQLARGSVRFQRETVGDFKWRRDFPVALQESQPDGESILDFEFDLDADETAAFVREVKSQLNGNLPIRLRIGPRRVLFQVTKRGPGAKALSAKRDEIVGFLGSRIQLDYVPAVRTADQAVDVVRGLVDRELRVAELDPSYSEALQQIADLQQPILERVSQTLASTLQGFLPDVQTVALTIPQETRVSALRTVRIVVDDGAATELHMKGDGAQSLAALSLIRHATQRSQLERILAVEEPEAHLHPDAIHGLRDVLAEIAQKQQVVLTTHSPVLINRLAIDSNILVRANRAKPAESVAEIREALGVRTSDNLSSADVVLVVEGESDRVALRALLADASSRLQAALASGQLALDSLAGGSNLSYKLAQLRDSLCIAHSYLDHDEAGRLAAERATEAGLLEPPDQTFVICRGMSESELEDMFDPALYSQFFQDSYNVDIQNARFRTNEKWSTRSRNVFQSAGQPFNERVERDVKVGVAQLIAASPSTALLAAKRDSFDALGQALERKLDRTSI